MIRSKIILKSNQDMVYVKWKYPSTRDQMTDNLLIEISFRVLFNRKVRIPLRTVQTMLLPRLVLRFSVASRVVISGTWSTCIQLVQEELDVLNSTPRLT